MLIDTHCHIHSDDYKLDSDDVISAASDVGVTKILVIGTDVADSKEATDFARKRDNVWPTIGLHPHDAKLGPKTFEALAKLTSEDIVAIGECGLDYYYNHSAKKDQALALDFQLALAKEYELPLVFHIRDAFEDFWPIFDKYQDLSGVVHSFTAGKKELEAILSHNLLVGLNGITTFTKDKTQLDAVKSIPLGSLVLETDAPFLTPTPFRGKINEPKQILQIAKFLSDLRGESLEELTAATTKNAEKLFNI